MVSIIVPTYQEAENLRPLVERISAALADQAFDYEIVLVDDDSGDGTDAVAAELAAEGRPVRLIVRKDARGLSSAVLRGFREAAGDVLLCMDADLSHPPEKIPDLVRAVRDDGCDLAVGSRYVPGGSTGEDWGFFRWLNSKVATLLARPLTRVKDPMAGFFALSRQTFERAEQLNPVGYKICLELLVKCRCTNVREVPIHFAQRKRGKSKMNLREQLNYLKHLKRLADFRFGWFSRFFQFCVVGSSGMAVDMSLYALLLETTRQMHLGRAIAIYVAMTWNFYWNRRFTFSYSRSGSLVRQYLGFVASSALGAAVSWTVATVLAPMLPFFRLHLLLAAVLGIIAGTVSNFLVSSRFVFRKKAPRARHADGGDHARARGETGSGVS